jgi:hypothetical protein
MGRRRWPPFRSVGYEYTDIGRAHWNGLIGGLRLWF